MIATTNLKQFLTHMTNNQLRTTNLFELEVISPYDDVNEIINSSDDDGKTMTYYGTGFTIPNRTHAYADVGFKGYKVPVPTTMQMETTHTITVRADSSGNLRRAFLKWQSYTTNASIERGTVFAGRKNLRTDGFIKVKLLSSLDSSTVVEEYIMYNVNIENVNGFQVSNEDGAIATFDVTFRSTHWETNSQFGGEPLAGVDKTDDSAIISKALEENQRL